jgi:1,2-diacylglycerol 3-alpha-glucosyltransferase
MYDEYIYYVAPWFFVPVTKQISHKYAKYIANRACALTGPSAKVQAYFRSVGVTMPINIIPNPVELAEFSPVNVNRKAAEAVRDSYHIAQNKTLAIFVGRLGTEKSVHVILDNWSQTVKPADNMHLLIAGDGPIRENLAEYSKKLGIASMVTFAGKVMHDQLAPYYAAADVYITASLSDTYSISMLEGMSMGLPVIQRYDEANRDQVINGVNGFTFNGAEEMYNALKTVRDMPPEELSAFRESTLGSVKSFGAQDLGRALEAVYFSAQTEHSDRQAGKKRPILLLSGRKPKNPDNNTPLK